MLEMVYKNGKQARLFLQALGQYHQILVTQKAKLHSVKTKQYREPRTPYQTTPPSEDGGNCKVLCSSLPLSKSQTTFNIRHVDVLNT